MGGGYGLEKCIDQPGHELEPGQSQSRTSPCCCCLDACERGRGRCKDKVGIVRSLIYGGFYKYSMM